MARHALHRRPLWHRPEHWVPLLAVTVAAMVIGSAVIVIKEGPALAAQVNPSIPSLRWVPGAPEEPIWPTVGQGAVAVTGVASLAAIVKQQSVEIPTAGMQMSYTPLVGVDGVVGIKSGLTTESGGCDLLALDAMVDGHPIQVIAAVLGQRGPNRLMDSGMIAYELARDRVAQFATLSVATTGSSIGSFGWTGHEAALHVTSDAIIPAWPGGVVRAHLKLSHQRTTRTVGGTVVGWLILRAGPITTRTPVATSQTVQPPTLLERLI